MTTRFERERGAIAVMIVVLMTALIALAAFATDLGLAYAVKRKLSVSVDAAALAAAAAVSDALPPGTPCDGPALQPVAYKAAVSYIGQNFLEVDSKLTVDVSVPDPICVAKKGGVGASVLVTVNASQQTTSFFGGIAGIGAYHPARSATAQLYVPSTGVGLRPIAACESVVQQRSATGLPFVVYVSKDNGICGTTTQGNWGYLNFLDQGYYGTYDQPGTLAYFPVEDCNGKGSSNSGGNNRCQTNWINDGYQGPVTVPNPISSPYTGITDNTGFGNAAPYANLVGKLIQLPVATRYDSSTRRMDVTGIVTVRVCAVELPPQSTVYPLVPESQMCSYVDSFGTSVTLTAPPDQPPWNTAYGSDPANNDYENWKDGKAINQANTVKLWLFPTDYTISGTIGGPGACDITDPTCDYGTRATRLYK